MALYRLTLEPTSAFRTPFQSDTLFGHLLWAYRYLSEQAGQNGTRNVEAFLDLYRQERPPVLISAGFPEGLLPVPALAARPAPEAWISDRVVADLLRKVDKEITYLPLESWKSLAPNLSEAALVEAQKQFRETLPAGEDYRKLTKEAPVTRTAIDRITGQAREGRLFVAQETFFKPPTRFDVWHEVLDERWLGSLRSGWDWIARNGFGRRKSAGAGTFRIHRMLEPVGDIWPKVDQPNGFVSLSAWVPKPGDPTRVRYETLVKRGKLAEQYALPNPWKKPLLMLEPGAVAWLPAGETLKTGYGRLVENIHEGKQEIVQYGFALPLGVYLPDPSKTGE